MTQTQQDTLQLFLDDIVSLAVSVGRNEMSWRQECRDNATIDNILLSEKKRELVQWLYSINVEHSSEAGEGEI